jgi:hypothetical protein
MVPALAIFVMIAITLGWLCIEHPMLRYFLSGRHLDGVKRSDCGFLHRGKNPKPADSSPSRWCYLAGAERLGYRLVGFALPPAVLVAYVRHPAATIAVGVLILAGLLTLGGAVIRRAIADRRHDKAIAKPLEDVLRPMVGQPRGVPRKAWIESDPRRFLEDGVTVHPPREYRADEEQTRKLAATAASRLGGTWKASPHMTGMDPTIHLRYFPDPPDLADWPTLEPYFMDGDPSCPVIGLGPGGQPVTIDFDGRNPHLVGSMPTGGGKSALARILCAWVLHHGGNVVCVDSVKKRSLEFLYLPTLLPGVRYIRDGAAAHDAFLALQHETVARFDKPDFRELPRKLIIIEEINSVAAQMQVHWMNVRPRGNSLYTSPAMLGLQEIMNIGRECHVNVAAFAQKAIGDVFGGKKGAAARENCTPIIGDAASVSTISMLATHVEPEDYPHPTGIPGRASLILGPEVHPVQMGWLTDQQARAFAISGIMQPDEPPEPPREPVFA